MIRNLIVRLKSAQGSLCFYRKAHASPDTPGQVPGHLREGEETLFSRGWGGPHSVPQLSSGPGASSSGWMRTSAWAAEGTPAPDPVTNPDGCQGGPEGAPEQPAPMQLPPRGLEASQQASGLLPTHHLLLPSYFLGAGTCFLCLLLHPHGCRTLPGPGRVPVGVCRLNE